MTDHEQLETMLRSSLTERASDVDPTPALYERVQRQATRGTWIRRGVALAGAAAVVAVAFVVVPPLLPEPEIDIAETPDDAAPTGGPTDAAPPSLEAQLLDAGLAFATDLSSGGSSLQVGDRVVTSPVRVVSLAVSPLASGERDVAAGREDGTIGVIDSTDAGDQFDRVVEASANGSGVTFAPAGDAIAWIQGTELHVLPASDGAEARVLPLVGEVPDDLRIEQWFSQADAQVILASDPDGGVWRIPMDDSNSYNSEPTDAASLLPGAEAANDALLLPDTQLVTVRPDDGEGLALNIGGEPAPAPELVHDSESVELSGPAGQMLAMLDPATGRGAVQSVTENASGGVVVATWESPRISAVVPTLPLDRTGAGTLDLPTPTEDMTPNGGGTGELSEEAAPGSLGLDPVDLLATDGSDLLVRDHASGAITRIEVFPVEESEAALGRVDVAYGGQREEAPVVFEATSEGETSVWLAWLRSGEVELLERAMVVDSPLTGLVWGPAAQHVAYTTEEGTLGVIDVDLDRDAPVLRVTQSEPGRAPGAVTGWWWESFEVDGAATGEVHVTEGGPTGRTHAIPVARDDDGAAQPDLDATQVLREGLTDMLTQPLQYSDVDPVIDLSVTDAGIELRFRAGNPTRMGSAPLPPELRRSDVTGADTRLTAVQGSVVVQAPGVAWEIRLVGDGEVVRLPDATSWTPLG